MIGEHRVRELGGFVEIGWRLQVVLRHRRLHGPYRGSVRWIVDGMNVIGARPDGWWKDRRRAMAALVDRLERWAADEGDDVTVVFERPPAPPIDSSLIAVAHAQGGRELGR